jgi:hypothetical protein
MAHIHIINAELDEGQTAALGLVARHKRAHPRPGTIGADDEIERAGCRLFKRELITFCLTVLVGAECRCTGAQGLGTGAPYRPTHRVRASGLLDSIDVGGVADQVTARPPPADGSSIA